MEIKRENKGQTKERLTKEGRWKEYVAYREGLKQRYKDDGMPGQAAANEAHRLSVLEFQPLDGSVAESYHYTPKVPKGVGKPDIRKDVKWVYENLSIPYPEEFPSPGCRVLHREARKHQWEFLQMSVKLMVERKPDDVKRVVRRQNREFLATVDEMLSELKKKGVEDDGQQEDHDSDGGD